MVVVWSGLWGFFTVPDWHSMSYFALKLIMIVPPPPSKLRTTYQISNLLAPSAYKQQLSPVIHSPPPAFPNSFHKQFAREFPSLCGQLDNARVDRAETSPWTGNQFVSTFARPTAQVSVSDRAAVPTSPTAPLGHEAHPGLCTGGSESPDTAGLGCPWHLPRQSHVRRLGAGNAAGPLAVCGAGVSHGGTGAQPPAVPRKPGLLLPCWPQRFATAAREIADKRGLPRVGWRPEVKRDQLLVM